MNNVTCDHCGTWRSRNPNNVQHITEPDEDGRVESVNYCDEECAAAAAGEGDDGET